MMELESFRIFLEMSLRTVLICLVLSAIFSGGEARVKRGFLGNLFVDPFQKVWAAIAPEKSKQACRALGWEDINQGPADNGLVDALVPDFLANTFGAAHGAMFPEEWQKRFCENNGMRKVGAGPPPTPPRNNNVGTIYCGAGHPPNPLCPPAPTPKVTRIYCGPGQPPNPLCPPEPTRKVTRIFCGPGHPPNPLCPMK